LQQWVDQIGKYQLVGEIARGGMGIVYLSVARGPKGFSKLLVLKELKPELVEDPVFLEMFLEEARLAARLNHPNIVHTYDVGAEGARHYIVMDYLEGYTLARVLRKRSPKFTLNMQLRVLCEVLQGLHYAHTLVDYDGSQLAIVHRDSTPQNVFLTFDGQVKIVDFGIAKAIDSTIETRAGILKGKPAYMAPEQIGGDVDVRVDVFAAGVMLWEAVAGKRMWHGKPDVEVLASIIKGEVPALKDAAPDAPEALVRIVTRATEKNRENRYASAAEMQTEIDAYLKEQKATETIREVGLVIAELFTTERAAERATIEAHLSRVKEGQPRSSIPSIRPPMFESSGTPSGRLIDESAPQLFTPSGRVSGTSLGTTPSGTEMPTQTEVAVTNLAARRQKLMIGAGAIAAAILIAVVSSVASRTSKPAASEMPVAKMEPTPPPAVNNNNANNNGGNNGSKNSSQDGREHLLTVTVAPPGAALTIDGRPSSPPASKKCIHGQTVLIHASKSGFNTKEREVLCESDSTVEVELDPQPVVFYPVPAAPPAPGGGKKPPIASTPIATSAPVAPVMAASQPAAPPTRNPNEVSTAGGTRPNRPIDTASPYGNP
jgi:serine/threonine protein kinase